MKNKYLISNKSIDRRIRLIGKIIRKINPYFDKDSFIKCNKIMDKHFKNKWFSLNTKIETIYIQREDGSKLRVLIARNKKEKHDPNLTGILWIHGGGYAIGLPEQSFIYASLLLKDKSSVMILPDYRRSIESPYPSQLEDCYLTLKWMYENSEKLNINKNQIFIGGESAGGGLAIALSLYLKDHSDLKVAGLIPIYSMIDYFETSTSKNNDSPVWNTKSNKEAWNLYLKNIDINDIPIYASPSLNKDFKNLPPLITYIGTLDPFYEEVMTYVNNLRNNGIDVKIKVYEGCFHAFDLFGYFTSLGKSSRKFLLESYQFFKENYFIKD